jgi:chorismate--pyruvate lyase
MFQTSRSINREPHWFLSGSRCRHTPPPGILEWLADPGSLTQRVRAACHGRFSVNVRRQGYSRPYYGEVKLLQARSTSAAVVREVELQCSGKPWVFARTIIPVSSLRGPARRLTMLGSRPLGAVLFADPTAKRGQMQFAELMPGQSLFESAVVGLPFRPQSLWGRRTLFHLAGNPLLVNEIFLPGIPVTEDGDYAAP